MELARRIAQLPPRLRLERLALVAFPVTVVMTVLVVALSAASIYCGHSPGEVALSVGLALTAVVVCGAAGVNARRTLRACRSVPPASSAVTLMS